MSPKWLIDSIFVIITLSGAYFFNIFGNFLRLALYFIICIAIYFFAKYVFEKTKRFYK